MVCKDAAEEITADRALVHAVHHHAVDVVPGVGRDRERLIGAGIDRNRPRRGNRAARGCRRRDREDPRRISDRKIPECRQAGRLSGRIRPHPNRCHVPACRVTTDNERSRHRRGIEVRSVEVEGCRIIGEHHAAVCHRPVAVDAQGRDDPGRRELGMVPVGGGHGEVSRRCDAGEIQREGGVGCRASDIEPGGGRSGRDAAPQVAENVPPDPVGDRAGRPDDRPGAGSDDPGVERHRGIDREIGPQIEARGIIERHIVERRPRSDRLRRTPVENECPGT